VVVVVVMISEKKETVDLTTRQIEDAISALDPGTRAAVIARLTADASRRCWWVVNALTMIRRVFRLQPVSRLPDVFGLRRVVQRWEINGSGGLLLSIDNRYKVPDLRSEFSTVR
jgi:hypothetical protein